MVPCHGDAPEGEDYVSWQTGEHRRGDGGAGSDDPRSDRRAAEPPRSAVLALRGTPSCACGGRGAVDGLDLDVAAGRVRRRARAERRRARPPAADRPRASSGSTRGHDHRSLGGPVRRGDRSIGYVPQQRLIDAGTPLRARDLSRSASTATAGVSAGRRRARRAASTTCSTRSAPPHYADAPVASLSGGEQQRLRVGQALAADPALLLCDEPLLSLDLRHQRGVTELIDRQRRERGAAVLFVTHDVNPMLDVVDRVLYLAGGRFRIGTPDEVLRAEVLQRPLRHAGRRDPHHGPRVVIVGGPDSERTGTTTPATTARRDCRTEVGADGRSGRPSSRLPGLRRAARAGAELDHRRRGARHRRRPDRRRSSIAARTCRSPCTASASCRSPEPPPRCCSASASSRVASSARSSRPLLIGLLGARARDRNSIIAVLMPFGLGLGILCLALYHGPRGEQVRPAHRADRLGRRPAARLAASSSLVVVVAAPRASGAR